MPLLPSLRLSLSLSLLFSATAAAADFPAPNELKPNPNLPDALVMLDGTRVTSKEAWEAKRKPELKSLFQNYMYGRLPPKPKMVLRPGASYGEEGLPGFMAGKADLYEVELAFECEPVLDPSKHQMRVLLLLPHNRKGPVPVFVGMNFCGNHTVVDHPKVLLPSGWVRNSCAGAKDERATDEGRGGQKDVWNVDLILSRGYGLATFYSGDIDPDTADFSDGIAPTFFKSGTAIPSGDDPSTIACWAWGFSRVVDWLEQYPHDGVDKNRLIAVGHSRNGKTALLAGAMDERFALVIPHQAGCGGTGPSRSHNPKAETVARINTSFPHWFCPNFKAFNDSVERLPFDQHCLVALCAPRPVLLSNAIEDQWANPDGQFEMLQAATPVYQLLGAEGLAAGAKPEVGKLIDSRLGYYLREGKHSMSRPDWEAFLDFADRNLGKAK
jgi:hypothetical protein